LTITAKSPLYEAASVATMPPWTVTCTTPLVGLAKLIVTRALPPKLILTY
jgi:hypothetical protein